jgi:hypothetical protein
MDFPTTKGTAMTMPEYTIQLLDRLNLTDEQFEGIHHWGKNSNGVASMKEYCRSVCQFRTGGKNHQLMLVLEAIAKHRGL